MKYYAYWCCARGSILESTGKRVDDWCNECENGNWLMEGSFVIPQALILSSDLKTKRDAFETQFNLSFGLRHPLGYPPNLPQEMKK